MKISRFISATFGDGEMSSRQTAIFLAVLKTIGGGILFMCCITADSFVPIMALTMLVLGYEVKRLEAAFQANKKIRDNEQNSP